MAYYPHMNPDEYEIFSEDLGSSSSSSSSSSNADEVIDCDPANSPRFITASAERQYHRSNQRHIMIERQFEAPSRTFEEAIWFHNWAYLTMALVAVNMEIVREFYANASAGNRNSVFLRGSYLQVNRHHINLHYLLPDYPNDTFSRLVKAENTDHLLNAVGLPGATWIRNAQNEALYVLTSDLTAEARMWLLFINSRLMPTTQTIRATRERVLLIYAIQHRFTIDIGRLILWYIRCAQRSELTPMFFPVLLSEMAARRGIDITSTELPQPSLGLMGMPQWHNYLEEERETKLHRGL